MLLFLVSFVISSLVNKCSCCEDICVLKYFYNFFKVEGYLRTQFIKFVLEGFFDLFLISIVNFENFYLFNYSSNWGIEGNLTFGDQFTVLFGILFSFIVFMFPMMNIFLLLKKVKFQHSGIGREIEKEFDEMYNVLYE